MACSNTIGIKVNYLLEGSIFECTVSLVASLGGNGVIWNSMIEINPSVPEASSNNHITMAKFQQHSLS